MWKILLGAVLLLFFASVYGQVSPGDEDQRCMNQITTPYDENVMMLMNSRHYMQLLDESGAVWDAEDYDDNNNDNLYNPTSFLHNAGGICRWSVMSCGYPSGFQNNWLFTQFISKNVPGQTNYTVTVTIDLSYTLSSCRRRYNCNPEISVFKFDTSGPQPRSVYTDRSNYKLLINKPGASTRTQNILLKVDILPEVEGFYLAIKDNTSCIQVAQLQVYRYQCGEKQERLLMFPVTAAPAMAVSNMTVTHGCMPNSSPNSNVDMMCDNMGLWSGEGDCICDPGYVRRIDPADESRHFCESCPAGTYRSSTDPEDGDCIPCPKNTDMTVEAAEICKCLPGYFRNTEGFTDSCPVYQIYEDASFNCTKPPSNPIDIQKEGSTESSISFSWSSPTDLGCRDDLYYTVEYSDPDNVGVMLLADCGSTCLTDTHCTINNLQPATTYAIRVTAHNGVSDQDRNGELARIFEFTCPTDIAPPPAPCDFMVYADVAVWKVCNNVPVTHFEICISVVGRADVIIVVEADMFFFLITTDIPQGAQIKIRAVNSAGAGPYTPLQSIPESDCDCDVTTPPPTTPSTVPPTGTVTKPGVVNNITLMGNCHLVWKPPIDMGGERPGYVVKYFDGTTYQASVEKYLFNGFYHDNEKNYFKYGGECPTDKPFYAQVRAKNSAGGSQFSERIEVNPDRGIVPSPTTVTVTVTEIEPPVTVTRTRTTTETSTETETSSTTDTVTDTETETVFRTQTISRTATVTQTETQSTTSTVTESCTPTPPPTSAIVTTDPPTTETLPPPECPDPNSVPSDVINIRVAECHLVWDASDVLAGCENELEYKIRIFSGATYWTTVVNDRRNILVQTNSAIIIPADLPTSRPLRATIKARRGVGLGTPWSLPIELTRADIANC